MKLNEKQEEMCTASKWDFLDLKTTFYTSSCKINISNKILNQKSVAEKIDKI